MNRRIRLAATGAALALAMSGQTVLADHTSAGAFVTLIHNSTVASYSGTIACSDTTCRVDLLVSKRDAGRAERWGCNPTNVIVEAGRLRSQLIYRCQAPNGSMVFDYSATVAGTHASDVTVVVNLVPG